MDPKPLPVLLVDDEPQILEASRLILRSEGIGEVLTMDDSRKLLPLLETRPVGAVVLDLSMPLLSGIEVLPEITRRFPQVPVIVMTAISETQTAIDCMKTGAFDYLLKPVESGRLVSSVKKALELQSLNDEISSLRDCFFTDTVRNPAAFSAIVTASPKMRKVFQYMEVVACSQQPILITGETGSGKELVAQAIHALSGCKGPYVPVNAAGLDDNMFSDALFGHKKGAFTGADQAREGFIARGAGGTVFLDEIGDLNEASQVKLLRLLQEKDYYPVGSDLPRKCEARVICATNRGLSKAISEGKFRNDLYFRLCAHQVRIPPLRERLEDLPLLIDHFLGEAAKAFGKKKPTPPPELPTLLATYHFPGNCRELQAMVFDAVACHTSGVLSMENFKNIIGELRGVDQGNGLRMEREGRGFQVSFDRFPTAREMEDVLIGEAMKLANSNQGIAASLLGITRQTLNKKLQGQ